MSQETYPNTGLFTKKPVTVFAAVWYKNGDHPEDDCFRPSEDTGKVPTEAREGKVVRYFRHPSAQGKEICGHCGKAAHEHGWIDTLEGGHIVCSGDYIITGVKGERYPCKPDIFRQTYSPAGGKDPMLDRYTWMLAHIGTDALVYSPEGHSHECWRIWMPSKDATYEGKTFEEAIDNAMAGKKSEVVA